MQIKIRGNMSIADVRQALFEVLHEIEESYGVRFSRGGTLFLNPTDKHGDDVIPHEPGGRKVNKLYCSGPYRSAADEHNI